MIHLFWEHAIGRGLARVAMEDHPQAGLGIPEAETALARLEGLAVGHWEERLIDKGPRGEPITACSFVIVFGPQGRRLAYEERRWFATAEQAENWITYRANTMLPQARHLFRIFAPTPARPLTLESI